METRTTSILENKLNAAITDTKFNFIEIRGFQEKPRLALLAGAAIGYRVALNDLGQDFIKIVDNNIHAPGGHAVSEPCGG